MFCCALLCVHSSLSSWCLVIIVWHFLAVPQGCLQFVIVVFPDNAHLLNFKLIRQIPLVLKAPCLDLDLSTTNGIVLSKMYDE